MKRIMAAAAALLIAAGVAFSAEVDIESIRAKLADQEARINDLQAKLSGEAEIADPEGVLSIRKNAIVTLGGYLTTKYYYTSAKADGVYDYDPATDELNMEVPYGRREAAKIGSLQESDAELHVQIDVNDHFEAFMLLDLHNGMESDYSIAKEAYVRWKNICETGFGLTVGRTHIVFGEDGFGELKSYAAGGGDGLSELEGYFGDFGAVPPHNGWDIDGATQITPYWEGFDGKLVAEVSFMQNIDNTGARMAAGVPGSTYTQNKYGYDVKRSKNYAGTMSARLAYTPIEDLKLSVSAVNFRSNGDDDYRAAGTPLAKNNTAIDLAVNYRPAFFNRLNVWAQWVHGWNVDNVRGQDSDAVNVGAAFDLNERFTLFAQGDYVRAKGLQTGLADNGKGWSVYGGVQYKLPYGFSLEAGWKHEQIKYDQAGARVAKFKGDTAYIISMLEF